MVPGCWRVMSEPIVAPHEIMCMPTLRPAACDWKERDEFVREREGNVRLATCIDACTMRRTDAHNACACGSGSRVGEMHDGYNACACGSGIIVVQAN